MGTYWQWICRDLRERFDPDMLLGPELADEGRGYGIKSLAIPYSAWVVGILATDRWYGHDVRLVCDAEDDWDEASDYVDVSYDVVKNYLGSAPLGELKFMCQEAGLKVSSAANMIRDLKKLADGWPPACSNEECMMFGRRHCGECEFS